MTKAINVDLNEIFDGIDLPNGVNALKIGVALSGGRDSVALAYALLKAGADIFAVNVEHGIRGESSVRDTEFVKDFCKRYGIELKAFSVDAPDFSREHGYTLEQGARILRYSIFDSLLDGGECDYIALAHHADDQAETVLMRILRGTGLKGLAGMRRVSGKYIRPLLFYDREDVNAYVIENGLAYVDDETNSDETYTRNFLRNEIAVLKGRYPALNDSIARLSRNASEAEEFIDEFVPVPETRGVDAYVKISDLNKSAVAKRLVVRAAEAVGVFQDIEERHFPLIFALCERENGKMLTLTHGLCVHKDGEYLAFCADNGNRETISRAFCEGDFEDLGIRVFCAGKYDANAVKKGVLFFDADKVPDGAVFRFRREGDRINKFGGGSKSLGDYLTDKKIPLRKRERIAVLACGNEVLAVAGVDISSNVAVSPDTKRIYALEQLEAETHDE